MGIDFSSILTCFGDRLFTYYPIGISHVWLNLKGNDADGMASVLGFQFDDLMLMFQALGLLNANLGIVEQDTWPRKLGFDVDWRAIRQKRWYRFPQLTDS